MILRYSELILFPDYHQRLKYLQLNWRVGNNGFKESPELRAIKQDFYKSYEWIHKRREIILRDKGMDLGLIAVPDNVPIFVHHLNPITVDDFKYRPEYILDPEYLISCIFNTHNLIHYGIPEQESEYVPVERRPNDTSPWRD